MINESPPTDPYSELAIASSDCVIILYARAAVVPCIRPCNKIRVAMNTFTTDSDAAQTNRIAYIGSSNELAGEQAGEAMVKALPNGGKCMGYVGLLGADNAKERIAGFKKAIEGHNITLADVRGDDIDQARAKKNVEDTLAGMPDITCMVGFYSYNPPRIYEALKDAGKLGQITVVAFDDDPITIGAVKDGSFAAMVVQQPFEWAYQGMKLMAAYLEGDKSKIPADGVIIVPTKTIEKDGVDDYVKGLAAMKG